MLNCFVIEIIFFIKKDERKKPAENERKTKQTQIIPRSITNTKNTRKGKTKTLRHITSTS